MRSQTSCHFYPRPPRGGRPCTILIRDRAEWISIHALREEGDARCCRARSFLAGFLSTPSARRATCTSGRSYPDSAISIHALREEGDNCSSLAAAMTGRISIHALREEGDPVGVAAVRQQIISIHALREEGDRWLYRMFHRYLISIHALREEGDMAVRAGCCCSTYFYPRPPRGGRLQRARQRPARFFISIHALREEGDSFTTRRSAWSTNFYPRPPRGGRPRLRVLDPFVLEISIHALREEGDDDPADDRIPIVVISIHALREEGDQTAGLFQQSADNFYPRPPRGGRLLRIDTFP